MGHCERIQLTVYYSNCKLNIDNIFISGIMKCSSTEHNVYIFKITVADLN